MNQAEPPHIAILMSTYNGEKFLQEQLESIAEQTHQNWSLWISDDGSTDQTQEIVLEFAREHPDKNIKFTFGPKLGFCKNFLSLIRNENIKADYYALADQDDIWMPKKLERGIQTLDQTGASLYGGRTLLIDEAGRLIGNSPLFQKQPSLENAMVQSIMGGNTMVVANEAMEHLRRAPEVEIISHDWWLYIYLSASGYKVVYDAEPMTYYRQHSNNIIGANVSIRAKCWRLKRLMRSEFKSWNAIHVEALERCAPMLTESGQNLVESFKSLQNSRSFYAVKKVSELGLNRQTLSGQVALTFAAFVGKI